MCNEELRTMFDTANPIWSHVIREVNDYSERGMCLIAN